MKQVFNEVSSAAATRVVTITFAFQVADFSIVECFPLII